MFDDFKKEGKLDKNIILKYKFPEQLRNMFENYGTGSFHSGFFKIINPDEYIEFVKKSYYNGENSIPVIITALGDIIVWERNEFITVIEYNKRTFNIISSGCDFFLDDIEDDSFNQQYFSYNLYKNKITEESIPSYTQCFGYEPLLSLGGSEKIENLKKNDMKVYLEIIFQSNGKIGT